MIEEENELDEYAKYKCYFLMIIAIIFLIAIATFLERILLLVRNFFEKSAFSILIIEDIHTVFISIVILIFIYNFIYLDIKKTLGLK